MHCLGAFISVTESFEEKILSLKFKLRRVSNVKYVFQNLFQLKTHVLCNINIIYNELHVTRTTTHGPSLSWINWSAVFRRVCHMSDVDYVMSCIKFELYLE